VGTPTPKARDLAAVLAITIANNSKVVSRRVFNCGFAELSTIKSSNPDRSQHLLRQEQRCLMDLLASATDFATKVQLAERLKIKESESSRGP